MDQFEKNIFVKKIIDAFPSFIQILKKKDKKISQPKKVNFYFDLFRLIMEINSKISDLKATVVMISSYPKKKPVAKIFSRSEYIIYHLEYYYLSIIAIYDRLLHLINFLYNLGLKDKHVKKEIILENKNVDKKIIKMMNELDKKISGIREIQNKIKHKSKYVDAELAQIAENETLANILNSRAELKKEAAILGLKAQLNYSVYLTNKKKQLKLNNDNLVKIIDNIYTNLYPQLEKRTKRFK